MKNRAFTLIELLVVVLIIGILTAIALPQYRVAVAKARFVQAMTLGDALVRAEQLYYLANNTYTTELENLDIDMPAGAIEKTSRTIKYHWGVCSINSATTTEVEIECYLYDGSDLTFVTGPGFRICRDHSAGNDVAKQVCLSLGGVKGNANEGLFTNYNLP